MSPREKKTKTNEQIAMFVSGVSIVTNLLLSAFKLFAGIVAHSTAMISDSVHSLTDLFGTCIVIAGIKMSNKKADKSHQYGHERLECVAAILVSIFLFSVAIGIGWMGLRKIIDSTAGDIHTPGMLALIAALVSIVVKEAIYWYTRAAAKKINSVALMAEAWHHRSDSLGSLGAFAGILGARLGVPILDPIACLVICLFILKAALDVFRDAIAKMTDRSCDEETIKKIRSVCLSVDSVRGIDSLRTRLFGDKIYVDLEISADGSVSLTDAHAIAEEVHDAIEKEFPMCKHCMVHVSPTE